MNVEDPTEPPALRVLHLDHAEEPGGAELALSRLLRATSSWTPVLILPGRSATDLRVRKIGAFDDVDPARISIVRTGPSQSPGAASQRGITATLRFGVRILGQALSVRRSAAFRSCSILHANTSRAAIYGALSCVATRKTLVVHLRDGLTPEAFGRVGLFLFRNTALRRADAFIANSPYTLSTVPTRTARRRPSVVIVSPTGTPRLEKPTTRSISMVPRIGMVARLAPWKGQEVLLRAFALVFADRPGELRLVGGSAFDHGSYRDHLESLASELGISERVTFTGHIDDVVEEIDLFDICVQASIRPEPMGQNVIQYMARCRPTIVTDQGGPAWLVTAGKDALTHTMGDVDSLAAALSELIREPALFGRLQIHARANPWVLDDAQVAAQHSSFFHSLSARRRSLPGLSSYWTRNTEEGEARRVLKPGQRRN